MMTTNTAYDLAMAVAKMADLVASANDHKTRLGRLELLEMLVGNLGRAVREGS